MTTWREQLQPASFRGVPFEVEDESSPAGRRTQLHEFVQRDKPFVEDLGRMTRPFSIAGFVAGDDCLAQRDALLAAIDVPGPAELVHPWFGTLIATCTRCSVSHSRREGGVVRFDFEFVESGDKGYPVATPHTASLAESAGTEVLDAGGDWYTDAMDEVYLARVQINALSGSLTAAYGQLATHVSAITRTVSSAVALADMVLNAPASVLGLVKGAVLSSLGSIGGLSIEGALQNLRSAAMGSAAMGKVNPAGGAQTAAVVQAVQELTRSALLAQSLHAAAVLPAQRPASQRPVVPTVWQQAEQPLQRPDVAYLPDVLAARDVLLDALWQGQQGGGGRPPVAAYTAYQDARRHARQHLAQAAAAAVPLVWVRPVVVSPALVLAHRQWGDATRVAEIVQRNRLAHPGFVPPVDLQVARE